MHIFLNALLISSQIIQLSYPDESSIKLSIMDENFLIYTMCGGI